MMQKVTPSKFEAISLMEAAETRLERLETTDKQRYISDTVKDYYEAIHSMIDAVSCLDGFKARGEGAHKELIDHFCQAYTIPESDWIFLQELREYRNRISYYGFRMNAGYLAANEGRITRIINTIRDILRNRLKEV